MGGSVGKSLTNFAKSPTRVLSAVGTGGFSELHRKTVPGFSDLQQKADNWLSGNGQPNPYISGPFSLDQGQFNADRDAINAEGQRQYADTLSGISGTSAAETQRAKDLFGQMLPDIAENAQAAHLYDSTGYGQEVARQQSNISSQIAEQEAQQKLSALQGLQGFQTGSLQRGLSMEDQINNANISKSLGQVFAPAPPTGKQNFGTVAQGVGALSPFAKLGKGGTAVKGAGAGAAAGEIASDILPFA